MPRGDGTGPMGMGPMSGRGAGFARRGCEAGPGLGKRKGFRAAEAGMSREDPTVTAESDKKALRHQLDVLQRQMDAIKKRLGETE